MSIKQKITPFLWFDGQAEEAANFYVSVFKNSQITSVSRYPEGAPGDLAGKVMTAAFVLDGENFVAMNGGPNVTFNQSISFVVNCADQKEVDHYWEKLTDGGQEVACGWLKDKYGLSWQIIPTELITLIQDKDREKAKKVMQAMMKMIKIDLTVIKQAYNS